MKFFARICMLVHYHLQRYPRRLAILMQIVGSIDTPADYSFSCAKERESPVEVE
jgi:hypothetical protein